MQLQKQLKSLPITSYGTPQSKRCLIVGGSGSGKTNLIINLLLYMNGLRFTHVYLYYKSLEQLKYNSLREGDA